MQEVWRNISADDLNKSAIAFVSDLGIKHSAVMIALIALIAVSINPLKGIVSVILIK